MFLRHLNGAFCAALLLATGLRGEERNLWPFLVRETNPDGNVTSTEYAGPLLFKHTQSNDTQAAGFRPFYLQIQEGRKRTSALFYPFFTWQSEDDYRYFTFFELINFRRQTDSDHQTSRNFDVWPFYFSRQTGEEDSSYRALFPIGGTIKSRFGYDRIHFVLFPLYGDFEKSGGHTTHAPWPFLRFIHGAGEHGFEFWPLFGHRGREGDYDSQFYLWPLIYKTARNLSEPQPDENFGVLPFYSRDSGPGYIRENYVWPFFGYTHRTEPVKYDEKRYLWPFFVQGRGDVSYVNRWAPFYTHSITKGVDKTWLAWPIFRHAQWAEAGIAQEQNQVIYFLYWSLTQRSTTNPNAEAAHKTHLWPLYSSWNNGAGLRQFQLLSPFEVFFPTNEPIRQLYTPLLAIYRYDQRAPGDTRQSFLFNLLSWKKSPKDREFHFGPLLAKHSTPSGARIQLGLGLLSWRRNGAERWKFSFFDFDSSAASPAPVITTP